MVPYSFSHLRIAQKGHTVPFMRRKKVFRVHYEGNMSWSSMRALFACSGLTTTLTNSKFSEVTMPFGLIPWMDCGCGTHFRRRPATSGHMRRWFFSRCYFSTEDFLALLHDVFDPVNYCPGYRFPPLDQVLEWGCECEIGEILLPSLVAALLVAIAGFNLNISWWISMEPYIQHTLFMGCIGSPLSWISIL